MSRSVPSNQADKYCGNAGGNEQAVSNIARSDGAGAQVSRCRDLGDRCALGADGGVVDNQCSRSGGHHGR